MPGQLLDFMKFKHFLPNPPITVPRLAPAVVVPAPAGAPGPPLPPGALQYAARPPIGSAPPAAAVLDGSGGGGVRERRGVVSGARDPAANARRM